MRVLKSWSRSGIALLSTLVLMMLIMALLVATLGSQSAQGQLLRYDESRQISEEAARSLLEYGRYKLEEDHQWLSQDPVELEPPRDNEGRPVFMVDEISREDLEDDYNVFIEGRINLPREVAFTMKVSNNFKSEEENQGLSPHTGTLEVTTRLGTVSSHYLVTLKNAPFANSTVAASGDIEIDTEAVYFRTRDSHRNQIRSEQNIRLPRVDRMFFEPGNNWQRPEKGSVWARADISVGPEDDPLPLDEATARTDARFIPGGREAYSAPSLAPEHVKADPEIDTIVEMPGGSFRVGGRELFFNDTSGALHQLTIPVVIQDSTNIYFEEALLASDIAVDHSTIRLSEDGPPLVAHPQLESTFLIDAAEFSLSGDPEVPSEVRFQAKDKVVCGSDLDIQGTSSSFPPTLVFIDDDDPSNPPQRGHLEVEGDLSLSCSVRNAGLLMASGDVNLRPEDIEVEATPADDVAICAGGDVKIDSSMVAMSGGNTKLTFRGLVYAGRDFRFDTDTGLTTPTGARIDHDKELEVIGSIVAQGDMVLQGPRGASLIYDPDFLDNVMEKSVRGTPKKLEIVSILEL